MAKAHANLLLSSMRIFPDTLHSWAAALLEASGLANNTARDAADVFLSASLRGVGHHDISFLPQRLEWIQKRGVNPKPTLHLERSEGAIEVWNGDKGLGEVCCTHITRRAIALSQQFGIGFATIRNSNHFLAASPYAELGVKAGCMILVFSNTDPCMAGPEGGPTIIGNDPFGYGIPRSGQPDLIADMCMAYSSLGNLRSLAAEGKEIPSWWGKDRDGNASTDPEALLHGGSVNPMARHKGFNLALMVEGLTGLLAGGATGNQVQAGGGINTHNQSVIAFSLASFGGVQNFAERASDLTTRLKGDDSRLRFPGERSFRCHEEGLKHGIEIPEALYATLTTWSQQLKVTVPQ